MGIGPQNAMERDLRGGKPVLRRPVGEQRSMLTEINAHLLVKD